MLAPRPYQQEALDALYAHIASEPEVNPCIVLPTGAGKSLVMAWMCHDWIKGYPPFRACVLAHRKELVEQNSAEFIGVAPWADVGVYQAALGKRDMNSAITFAGIDSIYNKWNEFAPFNVLIVDEAHRIPPKGEGKYRRFIEGCRQINPKLVVVGVTATPYRMGCGPICHRDHILNKIIYEANVADLIENGYLCRLRSQVAKENLPDLSNVQKSSTGDYVEKQLSREAEKVVIGAVRSAMQIIIAEKRRAVIFFCVDVEHCNRVSLELRKYGVDAPAVTGKTPKRNRERYAKGFVEGRYNALCNVNVYTEGFNAKRTDCIVLLRPTLSKGMFSQMVGRGLRVHPDKTDCLVLDFACCIAKHGPIDALDPGSVMLIDCPECNDAFSRAVGACPNCGWVIPKEEVERHEREEAERRMHEAKASEMAILAAQPFTLEVDDVRVERHSKQGAPDSLRVTYWCGMQSFSEWICLDHSGYPAQKAHFWWVQRFGRSETVVTVDSALNNLFVEPTLKNKTKTITVKKNGRYHEIIGHELL